MALDDSDPVPLGVKLGAEFARAMWLASLSQENLLAASEAIERARATVSRVKARAGHRAGIRSRETPKDHPER